MKYATTPMNTHGETFICSGRDPVYLRPMMRPIFHVLIALVIFKVLDKLFLDDALSGLGK